MTLALSPVTQNTTTAEEVTSNTETSQDGSHGSVTERKHWAFRPLAVRLEKVHLKGLRTQRDNPEE